MKRARKIARLGVMLAVITVLSAAEHALPPLPLLPPNVRLGISNCVIMYCVFFAGNKEAVALSVLKSAFVLLTRGPPAGFISICGGLLAIAVIISLHGLLKNKLSYILTGISGAVAHNIGQTAAASVLLGTGLVFYYLPILIPAGIVLGSVTGTALRVVLPALRKTLGVPVEPGKRSAGTGDGAHGD